MAAPYTPVPVTQGYSLETMLNYNFNAIATAFETVLNKDSATDNAMQVNLDMNGYNILNVGNLETGGVGNTYSIVAGIGIEIDDSDPENLVISSDFNMTTIANSYTLTEAERNQWKNVKTISDETVTCPLNDPGVGYDFVHFIHHLEGSSGTLTVVLEDDEIQSLTVPPGGSSVIPPGGTVGVAKISTNAFVVFGITEA